MSGLSTSLAILCHELPHEIGDFAMLLKAGMTVRQAVFYNVLSSVLALLGMVAGLLLGTIHNFSSWMFAATAGTVTQIYDSSFILFPQDIPTKTTKLQKQKPIFTIIQLVDSYSVKK